MAKRALILEDELKKHDNNYGFNPRKISSPLTPLPSLSIVIPYYETGDVINLTIKHLMNSLRQAKKTSLKFKYEIIVIDDGSNKLPVKTQLIKGYLRNIKIISLKKNKGRSHVRNLGLSQSKHEKCLFIDSDIIIDKELILRHLGAHRICEQTKGKKCITVSFFQFTNIDNPILKAEIISPKSIKLNDFRIHAHYEENWIGCDEDKEFIGQEIRIVDESNKFKNWHWKFKAWSLPNMVLGGFFIVDRKESLEVGGFSQAFTGYGFTEISLPTKLIAIKHDYVVPILDGGALHVDDLSSELPRSKKDLIFKKRHNFYFNEYLKLDLEKAIQDKIHHDN